jgi:hypothetical protein
MYSADKFLCASLYSRCHSACNFVHLGTCSLSKEIHRAIQLLWKYRYYLIVNVNGYHGIFCEVSVETDWYGTLLEL